MGSVGVLDDNTWRRNAGEFGAVCKGFDRDDDHSVDWGINCMLSIIFQKA